MTWLLAQQHSHGGGKVIFADILLEVELGVLPEWLCF